MSEKLINNSLPQLDTKQNGGITLLLRDSTHNEALSQLQITRHEISHEHVTLNQILEQEQGGDTISQQDIVCIAKDIATSLVYIHTHRLREYFNISLDPTSIFVSKQQDEIYHGQLILSLTATTSTQHDTFKSDLKNFAILLVMMATGITTVSQEDDNRDEILSSVQWAPLADLIHKCIANEITVDTLLTNIESMENQ